MGRLNKVEILQFEKYCISKQKGLKVGVDLIILPHYSPFQNFYKQSRDSNYLITIFYN